MAKTACYRENIKDKSKPGRQRNTRDWLAEPSQPELGVPFSSGKGSSAVSGFH
jgi:hypothetical protein